MYYFFHLNNQSITIETQPQEIAYILQHILDNNVYASSIIIFTQAKQIIDYYEVFPSKESKRPYSITHMNT